MSSSATAPKFAHEFARPQPGLSPQERVGVAAEWLRVSPYPCIPVLKDGFLVGLVTEASLTAYLLQAPTGPDRRQWLEATVADTVLVPTAALSPHLGISALLEALESEAVAALPMAEESGLYYGMVGHADLAEELLRPLALPQIGGMATPVGVHLSTGAVSAGVGNGALIATGFCFFFVQLGLLVVLNALAPSLPALPLPQEWRESLELLLTAFVSLGCFLGLIRLSPLAGYHAAEHQVVHALEHHVPLLPESVGRLSRVHPRCGTNLMAGSFLLGLGGALTPLLGSLAFVFSGLLALFFWRSLGAWFQQHLTTRTATTAQLTQAISAAKTLLVRHETSSVHATPLRRLLQSGLPQMLLGFLLGVATLGLLGLLISPLGNILRPHWAELLSL